MRAIAGIGKPRDPGWTVVDVGGRRNRKYGVRLIDGVATEVVLFVRAHHVGDYWRTIWSSARGPMTTSAARAVRATLEKAAP